jgi:predicted TIM-barrel fold metal-dependent hydrolase
MPRPARIVDAHVHLWDPAKADWYPYLAGRQELHMGDTTGMQRRFDVPTYRAEADGWNVVKLVNVAAATGRHSIAETLDLDRRAEADGQPVGIIGGLPPTDTVAEAIELIDAQMAAPRFRGVRPMGATEGPLPPADVLRALHERGLVFEVMSHPDQLVTAARGLHGLDGPTVVVEHTGWPRANTDEERVLWQEGIDALSSVGDHVHCKLSGLAMPLGSMAPAVLAPWIEPALEAFGVDRCFFASNFPVDGMHGTLDELWSAYDAVTSGLSHADRDQLFATNAEAVYRC